MLLDLWVAFTDLFLPVVCSIALLTGATALLAIPAFRVAKAKGAAALLLAFGFLGGVPGLIAGMSREQIVGALLTGLLALLSALVSYLFSKDAMKEWRPFIPYMIVALVVNALGGLSIGGVYKKRWEIYDRQYKEYALEREKVYLEVLKEERLLKLKALYPQAAADLEKDRSGKDKK